MVLCFVPDCGHKSDTDRCSMFCFPSDSKRKNSWIKLIRRADRDPSVSSRVCSCHFEQQDANKLPTVFERNVAKTFDFPEIQTRKKRRCLSSKENEITDKNNTVSSKKDHMLVDEIDRSHEQRGAEHNYVVKNLSSQNIKNGNKENYCALKKKIAEIELNNVLLQNQLQEKDTEITSQKRLLKEKAEEIALLLKQLEEKTEAKISLQVDLKKKEEKNVTLQKELEKEHLENISLQLHLKEKEDNNVTLQKELGKQHLENISLQERVQDLEKNMKSIKIDNLLMTGEVENLKKEIQGCNDGKKGFDLNDIPEKWFCHYTGLPNRRTFDLILSLFRNMDIHYYKKWKVQCLSRPQQLLITLMKLNRNFSHIDLAVRFRVSSETVSNVVLTWIHCLHFVLVQHLMAAVPSKEKNKASMPKSFSEYGSCRIILDCTEVFAAIPKKMSVQNKMYSNYKHRITLKGLVGIAPNGTVTYLSKLYPGSTSDKNIVNHCGVSQQLVPGDYVMADKGFLISDILPVGVSLNIPPFKTTPQFTPAQVRSTLSIAQARIHVERAIQRIKLFRILHFVPGTYIPFASKIFQLCGALANFKRPLIREVSYSMR